MKLLRRCFALGVAMCLICRKPALLLGRLLVALPNANFVAEAIVVRWGCPGRAMRDSSSGVERLHIPRGRKSEFAVVLALCSKKMYLRRMFFSFGSPERLSAPHFGPPASHTRIPDQNSGRYSSSGNQRQIGGHRVMNNGRRAGSIRKAEESSQKNERTRNPENDGAGIVALFITDHKSLGLPGPTVLGRGRRADDPHRAEGSPKRMSRRTKSNRGPGNTKLRSERPNGAKPILEAPSRSNVRSHDAWRY
ncbi:hypothetical protein CRG98_011981 [Punica granatum]|uniref:Secreted protein n=1 Tax=Punica granatum TaxID=22663 RepID=A0A2I0KGK2_PUNGR|nr:hypothetical protein CRG98_011981 [Punica granatum]